MKVTILQENLVKGVQAVLRMTASGGKLPVLSYIKLQAEKGGLFLLGTDLGLSVKLKLGAKVEKQGVFVVPAKIFGEFIASLSPGRMELTAKEEKLKIKSGANKASFQGMAATEFPEIPTEKGDLLFEYKGELEKVVGQVVFAAATEESRPALTGVQTKREGKELRLVATDGYRLSIKKEKVVFPKGKTKKGKEWVKIIPARAFTEVAYLVKAFQYKGGIWVGSTKDENQLMFAFGEVVVVSRLIEGEFPPFENIVPEKGESRVTFQYEELFSAARMAAIFARESANIVKWEVGERRVKIQANSPQVGENESVVEAEIEGPGGKIAFNSRYLLDFLNAVSFENDSKSDSAKREILFEMSGGLSPGLFKIAGNDSFVHVIMPVRIQDKDE